MTLSDPERDIGERVLAAFANAFPDEDITPESDFFDLGGDSLKAVAITAALSEALGRSVHPSALIMNPTVAGLSQTLWAGRADRDDRKS